MNNMDIKKAEAQIAAARYNCKEGWPFPDAEIILRGYEKAIELIKELESQNSALREACGLAQSMILSGEHISPKAEKIFEQALKGGD